MKTRGPRCEWCISLNIHARPRACRKPVVARVIELTGEVPVCREHADQARREKLYVAEGTREDQG